MTSRSTLLALALLLVSLPAEATVIEALDVEQLSRASELVVRGTALESAAEWVAGRRQIRTVTRVQVSALVKGEPGAREVEVHTPGGTIGDITQKVSGCPQLEPGDEVVLFLKRRPGRRRLFQVVGLGQGRFSVVREAGRELVVREPPRLSLLHPDGSVRPPARFGPVPLRQFVERVQKASARKP
ncbi:MAG: hypothetical protein ACOX6T_10735 [Myxococcales bacterium]|jgi:hypothetical protein